MKRQRLRPEKVFTQDDLKIGQKVLREWCGDMGVVLDPFAAADLCEKIAQAVALAHPSQHLSGE
jgi:hypothetical protein